MRLTFLCVDKKNISHKVIHLTLFKLVCHSPDFGVIFRCVQQTMSHFFKRVILIVLSIIQGFDLRFKILKSRTHFKMTAKLYATDCVIADESIVLSWQ